VLQHLDLEVAARLVRVLARASAGSDEQRGAKRNRATDPQQTPTLRSPRAHSGRNIPRGSGPQIHFARVRDGCRLPANKRSRSLSASGNGGGDTAPCHGRATEWYVL